MTEKTSFIVFYDGSCSFCRDIRRKLESWDRTSLLTWRSITEPGIFKEFPFLNKEKVQSMMHLFEYDTYLYTGFAAVKRIMQLFPQTKAISTIFILPGAEWTGRKVYRLIAKNRHIF
ncbi:thiol-disulfide oxidoreductase DCC family protein [Bacillus piscicola]|uniref:thiol-disulfide oxidoreductase DCC family protein n=1 Tax=Bacillus piscicola TaxID=1632684 RepID=UPI001F093168|nr:DUF393 domain-containing protein [Bacillus piscicola]